MVSVLSLRVSSETMLYIEGGLDPARTLIGLVRFISTLIYPVIGQLVKETEF